VAGVAVSAPLDLAVSVEHLHHMAGGLYEKFLVHRLRKEALRRGARYTPEERVGITKARGLVEFDNALTAPRHGWRDAAEYYAVNSSIDYLDKVTVPLLLIHAKDDPMVPFGPYMSVDWDALPTTRLILTDHGGHVGFHSRGSAPYYVGVAVDFLQEGRGLAGLEVQADVGDHRPQGSMCVEHILAPTRQVGVLPPPQGLDGPSRCVVTEAVVEVGDDAGKVVGQRRLDDLGRGEVRVVDGVVPVGVAEHLGEAQPQIVDLRFAAGVGFVAAFGDDVGERAEPRPVGGELGGVDQQQCDRTVPETTCRYAFHSDHEVLHRHGHLVGELESCRIDGGRGSSHRHLVAG
jgi:hypothetical protein